MYNLIITTLVKKQQFPADNYHKKLSCLWGNEQDAPSFNSADVNQNKNLQNS